MKKTFLVTSFSRYITLSILLACAHTGAYSQSDSGAVVPEYDLHVYKQDSLYFSRPRLFKQIAYTPSNIWQIAKAPFQKRNLQALAAVAVSTGILIAEDQNIINGVRHFSDQIGLSPNTNYHIAFQVGNAKIIKVPRNLNTALYQLGEGGTSMILAGGMALYGALAKDRRAVSTAVDLTETFVTMGLTTQILKRMTGRESPFVSTKSGGAWRPFPSFKEYQTNTSNYDGFPSGHLSTLMATITVLSYNYPEKKWIKPVGYSIMSLSAWAMMNTEVHWAGDYPLALAIGYLSGRITTMRHRVKPEQKVKSYL